MGAPPHPSTATADRPRQSTQPPQHTNQQNTATEQDRSIEEEITVVTEASAPATVLENAVELVDREYHIAQCEYDALGEFMSDIVRATPAASVGENSQGTVPAFDGTVGTASKAATLDSLRDAYESTVMATPHYHSEYDDSYEESLRAEFGADIGALLTEGKTLEPHHKRLLLRAVSEARNGRDRLLSALETERKSLLELETEIHSIDADLGRFEALKFDREPTKSLDAYRRRLSVIEDSCHELIEERQSTIVERRRSLALPISGPDVPTYVYGDLDNQYPLVAVLVACLERIEQLTRDIQEEITRRTLA